MEPLKSFEQESDMIRDGFQKINLVPFCRMTWTWKKQRWETYLEGYRDNLSERQWKITLRL